ncbi:MAG: glycerophosphodiester phosphodiesterase [Candidatus Thorarchaeota archaeon]|nr:glycerophosphodiester phosphodiesterase [Candidatus Thorarchaeota archaeon]
MKKQLVVAHRGGSGLAPENTMLAHRVAYDVGADMVEIDVQETLDGKLVCIHDYEVDRTTNGIGAIAELSLREILELDAGLGEKIPTLEEVLDYVRGKMKINIELKVTDIEKEVLTLVNERKMISDVTISSFLHGTLISTRRLDNSVSTAVLVSKLQDEMISYVMEHEANALNPDYKVLTQDVVAEAHSNNIQIFPWTVNEASQIRVLCGMGVDGIITDFPDVAVKVLQEISN